MEQEKKGVIATVAEGFKESTRNVSKINRENMAAVKAESKAAFKEATAPNPGFENFRQAKGLKNKAKAVADGMKASMDAASAKEKERRAEIKSFAGYAALLEEQREHRQAVAKK